MDINPSQQFSVSQEEAVALAPVIREFARRNFKEVDNGYHLLSALAKNFEKGRSFLVRVSQ